MENPELELRVMVLNINEGYNIELKAKCKTLKDDLAKKIMEETNPDILKSGLKFTAKVPSIKDFEMQISLFL